VPLDIADSSERAGIRNSSGVAAAGAAALRGSRDHMDQLYVRKLRECLESSASSARRSANRVLRRTVEAS
jgi:hypothetical protein